MTNNDKELLIGIVTNMLNQTEEIIRVYRSKNEESNPLIWEDTRGNCNLELTEDLLQAIIYYKFKVKLPIDLCSEILEKLKEIVESDISPALLDIRGDD